MQAGYIRLVSGGNGNNSNDFSLSAAQHFGYVHIQINIQYICL